MSDCLTPRSAALMAALANLCEDAAREPDIALGVRVAAGNLAEVIKLEGATCPI